MDAPQFNGSDNRDSLTQPEPDEDEWGTMDEHEAHMREMVESEDRARQRSEDEEP